MKSKLISIVLIFGLFLTAFSSFVFAAPVLNSSISATPTTVNSGDTINISMVVTNTGNETADNVQPSTLAIGGTGTATIASGPTPSTQDIPAGASRIFSWTYTAGSTGTVNFTGNAGETSGPPASRVSSTSNSSNNVTIQSGTSSPDYYYSFTVNYGSYKNIDFDNIVGLPSNYQYNDADPLATTYGVVNKISNRMIKYTPSGCYETDIFTFSVNQGQNIRMVQVTATITCNDPPIPDCTYYVDYNCATGDIIVGGTTYDYINVNNAARVCYPTSNYKGSIFLVNPNPGTAVLVGGGNQIDYSISECSGYCGQTDTLTFLADKVGAGGDIPNPITIKVVIGIICSTPTANPDTASVCKSACVNVSVLDNDSNYGTSPILTVIEGPTGGTAIQSGNKINYCAPATPGTYDFNYTVTNGQSTSNKAKVTVTVNDCGEINNPPVAVDDNYEICMNEKLTVLAGLGVLANDIDPENDPIEVYMHQTDIIGPANGTLLINEDGSFTYTPNEGFYGKDTFTYRAGDFDAVSERATVTITVLDCTTEKRKLIHSSILYPGIDIIQMTVPASGDNVILGGKVVSPLEVTPGTQSLNVQVKNKGFLTQIDAGVRFEGLPQGVTFSLEPSTQKIRAHSTGTYTLTLTVPPTTPSGTYSIKAVSYSRRGITDRVEFNLIVD